MPVINIPELTSGPEGPRGPRGVPGPGGCPSDAFIEVSPTFEADDELNHYPTITQGLARTAILRASGKWPQVLVCPGKYAEDLSITAAHDHAILKFEDGAYLVGTSNTGVNLITIDPGSGKYFTLLNMVTGNTVNKPALIEVRSGAQILIHRVVASGIMSGTCVNSLLCSGGTIYALESIFGLGNTGAAVAISKKANIKPILSLVLPMILNVDTNHRAIECTNGLLVESGMVLNLINPILVNMDFSTPILSLDTLTCVEIYHGTVNPNCFVLQHEGVYAQDTVTNVSSTHIYSVTGYPDDSLKNLIVVVTSGIIRGHQYTITGNNEDTKEITVMGTPEADGLLPDDTFDVRYPSYSDLVHNQSDLPMPPPDFSESVIALTVLDAALTESSEGWQILDLSAVAPQGTTVAFLEVMLSGNPYDGTSNVEFRKPGDAKGATVRSVLYYNENPMIIPVLMDNHWIEWWATVAGILGITVNVIGWGYSDTT